jgi:recombination protein RecT
MVVQGLNPDKKQCYFIVYGNKLQMQRSYFGSMAVAKAVNPEIEDIYADVIYEGDEFEYCKVRGRNVVVKHIQTIENVKKDKIKAAYCSVFFINSIRRC